MIIRKPESDTASVSTHSMNADNKVLIAVTVPDHAWKCVFKVKTDSLIRELQEQTIESYHLDNMTYLNYGLYLASDGVKNGKFLQEERPVSDYPQLLGTQAPLEDGPEFAGSPNGFKEEDMNEEYGNPNGQEPIMLEFLPKVRYVENYPQGEAKFRKINSKRHRKRFLSYIKDNDVINVMDRLYQGFDPNFRCSRTGNTPLGFAVRLYRPREMILQLVSGGAHLDYRDSESLTALHQAAICGNYESIKVLLELGMNPNVRDIRGLTPLYHAVSKDISPECVQLLLYDHAVLGTTDDKGRQEIHQACLFGRQAILEQLLIYGADLDALADNHNTPLHTCVLADHEPCLKFLLKHGAKRTIANSSGQTPYEFAVLIGRQNLADIIETFDARSVEPINIAPTYNKIRRPTPHGPRVLYETMLNQLQQQNQIRNHSNGSLMDVRPFSNRPVKSYELVNQKPKVIIVHSASADNTNLNNTSRSNKELDEQQRNKLANRENGGRIYHTKRHSDIIYQQSNGLSTIGDEYITTIHQPSKPYQKKVFLERANIGYGFVMQGISKGGNSDKSVDGSRLPLQRIVRIQSNSPASNAGLSVGDHLMEVNGIDVSNAPHAEVVRLILQSEHGIDLKVLSGLPPTPTANLASKAINRTSFLHADLRRRLLGRSSSFDVRRQNSVPNFIQIPQPMSSKPREMIIQPKSMDRKFSLDQTAILDGSNSRIVISRDPESVTMGPMSSNNSTHSPELNTSARFLSVENLSRNSSVSSVSDCQISEIPSNRERNKSETSLAQDGEAKNNKPELVIGKSKTTNGSANDLVIIRSYDNEV